MTDLYFFWRNFLRQANRIEKQRKISENKLAKNNEFSAIASELIKIGGGNISNLLCVGNESKTGELTDLTNNLLSCAANIDGACNTDTFVAVDVDLISGYVKTILATH